MLRSLKTTAYVTTLMVSIVLLFLLLLGLRQIQLNHQYEDVIRRSEKLVFRFSTIEEHITETLLENRKVPLGNLIDEVRDLNTDLTAILDHPAVPNEYKLSFIGQIDLPGLVLLLRKVEANPNDADAVRQLNSETRITGDRLAQFDRIIVSYAKSQIVAFQSIVIGALAMVIFLISLLFVMGYRRLAGPLFGLVEQVREAASDRRDRLEGFANLGEVTEVAASFNRLMSERDETRRRAARVAEFAQAGVEVVRGLAHVEAQGDLFRALCRPLASRGDVLAAWIAPLNETGRLDGLAWLECRPGSPPEECHDLRGVLEDALAGSAAGPFPRGLEAMGGDGPVLVGESLAAHLQGIYGPERPDGADIWGLALPLEVMGHRRGVLGFFWAADTPPTDAETAVAREVSLNVALGLELFELRARLEDRVRLWDGVFLADRKPGFVLDSQGHVLEGNPAALRAMGTELAAIEGRELDSVLGAVYEQDESPLRAAVKSQAPGVFDASATLRGEGLSVTASRFGDGTNARILVTLEASQPQEALPDVVRRVGGLAAVGELAAGVAHETIDLINGTINYGQVLLDEMQSRDGLEDLRSTLDKMVQKAEHVAEVVGQVLFLSRKPEAEVKPIFLPNVVSQALSLVERLLKNDGIRLTLELSKDLPPVLANVRALELVLLHVISNARYALNLRFPTPHEDKRMEIKAGVFSSDGGRQLRLRITDWGGGIDPAVLSRVFDPLFTTKPPEEGTGLGLAISRMLMKDQGGDLTVESGWGEYTTATLVYPLVHSSER